MNASAPHRIDRAVWWGGLLGLWAVGAWALGACIGSTGAENVFQAGQDEAVWRIVWEIRVPRTLGAWLAGALLGLSGALSQGLFRNPLADPYLLGSASGASLGVAVVLAFFGAAPVAAQWLLQLGLAGAAFVGAVGAVLLTLALARGAQHTLRLLLAGVIVGVVLAALGSLLMLLHPEGLQTMQAFMLGSTAFVGWTGVVLMAAAWGLCLLVSWSLARVLDGLSLGEDTALSLGLRLPASRRILVAVLGLAVGASVSQTGLIAFVGLAAPHLVRALTRTRHGGLALLSSLMGGALLLTADLLARWVLAPQELPVGVLTALLGGAYLLWLMHGRGSLAGRA